MQGFCLRKKRKCSSLSMQRCAWLLWHIVSIFFSCFYCCFPSRLANVIQEGSVNISRVQKGAQATFMWLVSGNVFRLQWTRALCGWPNMPTEILCPLRINVNIGQHSILKLKMRGRFAPSTGYITVLSHLMIVRYQEVRNDSKRTNVTPASTCFSTVGCAVSQR